MTPKEAREILLERFHKIASKEYPLVWVSEPLSEDEAEFLFEAAIYAQGENPKDDALLHAVNRQTGEVRALLNLC